MISGVERVVPIDCPQEKGGPFSCSGDQLSIKPGRFEKLSGAPEQPQKEAEQSGEGKIGTTQLGCEDDGKSPFLVLRP